MNVKNVLAVDDEETILELYRDLLREYGINILKAGNAKKALMIFDEYHIDAVITDLDMPGTDGAELTKLIRREKKFSGPVIMVSGKLSENDPEKMKDLGVDKVFSKPYSHCELAMHLRSLLIVREEQKSVFYVDDDAVSRMVAVKVFEDLGWKVELAKDGMEGLRHLQVHSKNYSLLVTDHLMPGLDGDKMVIRLKSETPGFSMTCILLTGTDIVPGTVAGFDAILQKPLNREKVLKQMVYLHLKKVDR